MAEQIVLTVDVGGSHVKALTSNESERRRFKSGPTLTAKQMVEGVLKIAEGWPWDVVSVGIPSPVRGGKVEVQLPDASLAHDAVEAPRLAPEQPEGDDQRERQRQLGGVHRCLRISAEIAGTTSFKSPTTE